MIGTKVYVVVVVVVVLIRPSPGAGPPERHQGAYGKGGSNLGRVYSIKEGGVYLLHAYVYISNMYVQKKTMVIGHLY